MEVATALAALDAAESMMTGPGEWSDMMPTTAAERAQREARRVQAGGQGTPPVVDGS
jgi:hypothetical protein